MRLQPVEIHPKMQSALEVWRRFASDDSLLNSLLAYHDRFSGLEIQLEQAVTMWSISSVLNELIDHPNILNKFRPTPSISDPVLSFFAQAGSFRNSSIVFRTYVSVVLGRTEEFSRALSGLQSEVRSQHLSAAVRLIRNDEVRILRNAVGHGTFVAKGEVLKYWDDQRQRRISFRELDELNFSIWSIILIVWAVSTKEKPQIDEDI